jgi:hypothetical protein
MENLHRMEGHRQANILFADCSSSNGGMFAGIVAIIGIVVCCVVILTNEGDCDYKDSELISNMLRICIMAILIIGCIYAYYILANLDVNPSPISFLDDMLLFFCLPAFFLYFIVWTAPLVQKPDAPSIIANVLILVQALIQTPMIVDGLRRCTNDPTVGKRMPGRNAITFLIVANLGVYIMETLLIKSYDYQKQKIEFYGPDAWTVLSHMTLPICIFYRWLTLYGSFSLPSSSSLPRFHSAVALVDIWNSAYNPPENLH